VHINPNNKKLTIRDISNQQAEMMLSAKIELLYISDYASQCWETYFTTTSSKAHDENQSNIA
jgi:hypothetical protein